MYVAHRKHYIMEGGKEGGRGRGRGVGGWRDMQTFVLFCFVFSTLHLDHGVQFSVQLFIKDIKNKECIERQWRYLLGRD